MKRIMLWGWYGFENLGDDLLLNTMLEHLHGEVTVPMNKPYVLQNVNEISRNYKNFILSTFRNDVLIIGPGGLFPFDNKAKVLLYYIVCRLWKAFGRKVIFFGIGISERMSNFSVVLWRRMAQKADLFIPRSCKVLERIGMNETKTIHVMADTVFASGIAFEANYSGSNRVLISVANLQPNDEKAFEAAVKKWIGVIKVLLEKGFKVDLIAFTKDKDDKMIESIISSPQIFRGGGTTNILQRCSGDCR